MSRLLRGVLGLVALVGVMSVGPSQAHAEQGDMDLQLLRPSFAPWGYFSTPGARPGRQWTVRAGLVMQYERGPLVVVNQVDQIARVVSDRVGFNLGGYFAPLDGLGIGLSIPLYAQSGNYVFYPVPEFAVGDLRLDVAYRLLELGHVALALRSDFFFPTSSDR